TENRLQTQAVVLSSEEYIERSQGARSIIARGFLPNEDNQALQNDNPDEAIPAILKRRRSSSLLYIDLPESTSDSESDEEGNISPCELASMKKEERHLLLYKKSTDDKNYTDDEVDEDKKSTDDEVYTDNVVDEDRKKKISEIPLREKQRKEINDNFNSMAKDKMWKLSSGRYVEEELYELGKKLDYEHAIHSFILDTEDEVVMNHFSKEEMEEIDQTPGPVIPELAENVTDCLSKFVDKTNLNEIRKILKEISFDDKYNLEKDHDVDYIIFAIHALKLGTYCRMGRRGDWILRSIGKGDNDGFGAGEAGKNGKINTLMEKVKWNPVKYDKIQTVGIVHAGFVSELMEVPDTPENFSSILTILASVLNLKSRIQEILKAVINSKENQDRRSFIDAGLKNENIIMISIS
ncbi:10639_t:CDS:2, partial [Ambispora gerdemannii]